MKASFCTLVLGNTQEAMAHAIPQLSSVGYDGLEFWDQYLSTADLGWLKETTDEFGMRIVQICPYFDFTSDGKAYEKSILDARRYVEYTRALDARTSVPTPALSGATTPRREPDWESHGGLGRTGGIEIYPLPTSQQPYMP